LKCSFHRGEQPWRNVAILFEKRLRHARLGIVQDGADRTLRDSTERVRRDQHTRINDDALLSSAARRSVFSAPSARGSEGGNPKHLGC